MSPDIFKFLRKIPLFASLSSKDLEMLCEMVTEERLPAGQELFSEGSMGDRAYVIKEGQIEIFKHSNGRNVLLATRKEGDVIGEMSLLEATPRIATGRAKTDSTVLAISHDHLDELLNESPSAARNLLTTIVARWRSTELMLQQSEKLAQLGTLTAGIAHELNNPAAAAKRGADQLRENIEGLQHADRKLAELQISQEQRTALQELSQLARERAAKPLDLNSLGRSDQQYEMETWLEEHGIAESWEIAPTLVSLGLNGEQLMPLVETGAGAGRVDGSSSAKLLVMVSWLCAIYTVYSLLEEISQGAGRISEIVKSLKNYAYLDQAPVQLVDIHESLDNTAVMLRSRLKEGIQLVREYAEDVPRIQAYGSELNQAWTNIIVNAIDALDGRGKIVIRTRYEGSWVIVEMEDNGPGIPEEIQPKLFSPFFTTKPVGKGTGLGLNITYNIIQKHNGEIRVYSRPGMTRFTIMLPVQLNMSQSNVPVVEVIQFPPDDELRQILETTRNIAVVGIGEDSRKPNFTVPLYLKQHGYKIIPVNPTIDHFQGDKAYPDLLSVSDPVDLVLIFRRSEHVPPLVNQAIQKGARVVWMQEGIYHQAAAAVAREAGLKVVMDTCIRATHIRLNQG